MKFCMRWSQVLTFLLLLFSPLALLGCTALTSETPFDLAQEDRAARGMSYALPKGLVEFELLFDKDIGQFDLQYLGTRFISDPHHRYVMRYQPNPFYHDTIDIVYGTNGFLQSVSLTSTDKTGQIILNLVKAFAQLPNVFESEQAAKTVSLGKHSFDPLDPEDVARAQTYFNGLVLSNARLFHSANCEKEFELAAIYKCQNLDPFLKGKNKKNWPISFITKRHDPRFDSMALNRSYKDFQVHNASWKDYSGEPSLLGDCGKGLCYRPRLAYELTYTFDKSQLHKMVFLPNKAPLMQMDLDRAFFIHKTIKVDFDDNGFLSIFTVKKPSELQAISMLPINVITTVTSALALRIETIDTQISEHGAIKELVQAKQALQQTKGQYEAALLKRTHSARSLKNQIFSPIPQRKLQPVVSSALEDSGEISSRLKPTF